MKAMVLKGLTDFRQTSSPLEMMELPVPLPGPGEVLLKVATCGVCHTELDEIEGRTAPSFFPIALGHQVVGRIVSLGPEVEGLQVGDRVGVGWIYSACGNCSYCRRGEENLCPEFRATGRDAHGGYAEYMLAKAAFVVPLPAEIQDVKAAPLLCAGAIGYRSLVLAGIQNGEPLGLTGFGASAHLVLKMTRFLYPDSDIYVFARHPAEREFALQLGASWAGEQDTESPVKLRAIIDTTPAWKPVVQALKNLEPGGRLVINAIRKEEKDKEALLKLDYSRDLWLEKEIKSVANVTRKDLETTLNLSIQVPILPEVETYSLRDANQALEELQHSGKRGAKVLLIEEVL
ncbi:MAG: zinc-dependent alcohol dehydrogenase family protein [Spirochaetes bacterium]|nr:zinc-dependent alcohol dehydrogenase family protein [Spirochaetota bacterium]